MLRGLASVAVNLPRRCHSVPARGFAGASTVSKRVASKREAVVPAEPATVKPYEHHIFVRLPRPADAPDGGPWWPSVVESNPALLGMFSRVAALQHQATGAVKITAMEDVTPSHRPLRADSATAIVYPEGVIYASIPVTRLQDVVGRHLTIHETEPEDAMMDAAASMLQGVQLFVCCHGSRDSRCGSIGTPLARRLQTVANTVGCADTVDVFMCSHVGGHKYAGNVLVFGNHPCSGDWFGGLRADDAEAFIAALTDMQVGSDGGPSDSSLRKWWRGRMGMEKEDQQRFFDCGCLEDDLPEDDGDDQADASAQSAGLR